MTTIGFIGLGNMGLPMAKNLIGAGFKVNGFDLSPDARAALTAAGGTACDTVRAAVEGADAVVSMLPSGAIVKSVYGVMTAFLPLQKPGRF